MQHAHLILNGLNASSRTQLWHQQRTESASSQMGQVSAERICAVVGQKLVARRRKCAVTGKNIQTQYRWFQVSCRRCLEIKSVRILTALAWQLSGSKDVVQERRPHFLFVQRQQQWEVIFRGDNAEERPETKVTRWHNRQWARHHQLMDTTMDEFGEPASGRLLLMTNSVMNKPKQFAC